MTESKILLSGIDSLVVGFCVSGYKLSDAQWYKLEKANQAARSADFGKDRGSVKFLGVPFVVKRAGTPRHTYILVNFDITIKISPEALGGAKYPEIQIEFRSEYLWRKDGWRNAYNETKQWVDQWASVNDTKVSRLDMMVDVDMEMPKLRDDFLDVVSRIRNKHMFVEGQKREILVENVIEMGLFAQGLKLAGYTFGSSDLMCRMYDKILEIKKSDKEWFKDLWERSGWQEGRAVTRIEFQCRHKFLKEMGIKSADDIEDGLADTWRYLTNDWLKLCIVSKDTNRTRWKVKKIWDQVQKADTEFGRTFGVLRSKRLRPKARKLEWQARGCCISYGALACIFLKSEDVSLGKNAVFNMVMNWLNEDQFDFDMRRRLALYGGME